MSHLFVYTELHSFVCLIGALRIMSGSLKRDAGVFTQKENIVIIIRICTRCLIQVTVPHLFVFLSRTH
jgi:hypothetical protein